MKKLIFWAIIAILSTFLAAEFSPLLEFKSVPIYYHILNVISILSSGYSGCLIGKLFAKRRHKKNKEISSLESIIRGMEERVNKGDYEGALKLHEDYWRDRKNDI